jgi:hypothetical protein
MEVHMFFSEACPEGAENRRMLPGISREICTVCRMTEMKYLYYPKAWFDELYEYSWLK